MPSQQSIEVSQSVYALWREPAVAEKFTTAVSLHSHTLHSRETLDFVPRVMRKVPLAHAALQYFEAKHRRRKGRPIPFSRAYWRPPLHPQAAYELERSQIQSLLGLEALVSITDHDTLEACAELSAIGIDVPYSLEWSVPYRETVFHIGVHNLPADQAQTFAASMASITAEPVPNRVAELLAGLDALEDVLVVLNHPFSCGGRIEQAEHIPLLLEFLGEFGGWLHALELNGLQSRTMNLETIRLAAARGLPVISGGDRHCCEPNANVNLTNARTFAEFVHEIRAEQRSAVLFLPQYRDPIPARYIELIWHAVRDYADFTGREGWADRVFFERESGEIVSCREEWPNGGPAAIRGFISAIGFLASPGMRPLLSMMKGRDATPEPEIL
jgi:hypothetical protein